MRLDKLLSNLQYGSRSIVKQLIKEKRVLVNNSIAKDGAMDVFPGKDVVQIDGQTVYYKDPIHLLLNKPVGYGSTHVNEAHPSVMSLLLEPYSRFEFSMAGRLDWDTEGLLLLSTDGNLIHRIISPKKQVFKTYLATLLHPINDYSSLLEGVEILDGENKPFRTKPAKIKVIDEFHVEISISEGKFHQVKRMFEVIANEVIALKRISIGNLFLPEDLSTGSYQELSEQDIEKIFENPEN
jgi:16S rRNA pseudouridine516 synthase